MFDNYDNSIKAMNIYRSYVKDMNENNMQGVRGIVKRCKTLDDLDMKLDGLLGNPVHFVGNQSPPLKNIDVNEECVDEEDDSEDNDVDANGVYSNARKILEEG